VDQAIEIVGVGLAAHQDDRGALLGAADRGGRVEHGLADGRTR
jgi:hypothetical protein